MSHRVFIDTSAWMAYYLSDEPDHIQIKNLMKRFAKDRVAIITSNDIIDETVTNLIYTNPKVAKKFIDFMSEGIKIQRIIQLWVDEQIQSEGFELVQKFSEHKLSLTDATSIALIKKFSIESVISLDSDFIKIGIPTLP